MKTILDYILPLNILFLLCLGCAAILVIGKIVNVVLKSSHCHVGMPTILSVSCMASRKSFVGNQRIQVFAKSLPVVSTHYCPPNLPAHPSSLFVITAINTNDHRTRPIVANS
jgi:hypothetical protein